MTIKFKECLFRDADPDDSWLPTRLTGLDSCELSRESRIGRGMKLVWYRQSVGVNATRGDIRSTCVIRTVVNSVCATARSTLGEIAAGRCWIMNLQPNLHGS